MSKIALFTGSTSSPADRDHCIKSTIGGLSFDRTMFGSTTPTKTNETENAVRMQDRAFSFPRAPDPHGATKWAAPV